MSDLAEPIADAHRFDVPGCTSPRLIERDDYASLFEAESGGQRVRVMCLGDDIIEHQQVTQAFVEQAEAIGTLRQPAFLGVLDSATAGADIYVVFESPDGVLLDDLCSGASLLPIAAAHLGAELCAGLEALHAEGVTHGGITPRGITIAQGEAVRIAPASLGSVVRNVPARELCRRLAYQAPEAIAEKVIRVEASADIYAVGVLLWEAVAGRPLLRADSVDAFVSAARAGAEPNQKIDRLVPAALTAALQRALDRNPSARPSAAELKTQLAAVAGTAGRATLAAATRKVRLPASTTEAKRLRVWAIPKPPPPAEPAPPAASETRSKPVDKPPASAPASVPAGTPVKADAGTDSPAASVKVLPAPTAVEEAAPAAPKEIAPAEAPVAKAVPAPAPAPPPAEEDEETRLWRRPERAQPKAAAAVAESEKPPAKPSAESEAESARMAALAAQLKDFDDEEDDPVKLPVPVDDLRLIGPSQFPAPQSEASSLSKRIPARARRKTVRPLMVGILVCIAVLCALLVVSVALPLPLAERPSDTTQPAPRHEKTRPPPDDPGKAIHGGRK